MTNLTKETVFSAKWLAMKKIDYVDPKGVQRTWETVERTTRTGDCDGVHVVAVVRKETGDELVLVKQFRPPVDKVCVEFPAGLVDGGESPEAAALRELLEETGYTGKVEHVSPVVCLEPGMSNANARLIHVTIDAASVPVAPTPTEDEFIEVVLVPVDGLLEKLQEWSATQVVDVAVYAYAVGLRAARR
eukprot:TRINITY_DN3548_c0_g1_i1.p1 TRINITY_DN3548_c0_g1~~TRINITY_DN3548_c0_g1_i1.p1  ORF type:complete len:189 (+),score=64.49 TRINITY_DN3548_c0_g1_i1:118-684(+)